MLVIHRLWRKINSFTHYKKLRALRLKNDVALFFIKKKHRHQWLAFIDSG